MKSTAKSAIDAVRKNPTMENLAAAHAAVDKAVKRNIYHANKAARLKSQLSKLVKPSKLEKKPAKKTAKKTTKKTTKTAKKSAKK